MAPTNLTLAERERWAYANGDVEQAALLRTSMGGLDDQLAEAQSSARDEWYREGFDEGYQEGFDAGMEHARECDA